MTATEIQIPRHPAKFSSSVLDAMAGLLDDLFPDGGRILDPFAGVGKIHEIADFEKRVLRSPSGSTEIGPLFDIVGVELEPEWAAAHPATLVGDATSLPFEEHVFDAVVTSPCYGNRMADHHEAKDACSNCQGVHGDLDCRACGGSGLSRRNTYRHALGRELTAGSGAAFQWGPRYRHLHEAAWREAIRVVKPGGFLLVNISNHIREGEEQRVVEWHTNTLLLLGCFLHRVERVSTPRLGFGANGDARVDGENIIVVRTPPPGPPRLL